VPGNFKKDDLRVIKTKNVLMEALSKLLEHKKFTQITVHDLCDEALISRATFYSHFSDKYDFLNQWLIYMKSETINNVGSNKDIVKCISDLIDRNSNAIKNLLKDANSETAGLLCGFLLSLLDISADQVDGVQVNLKYIVLSKFFCGGLINYLQWQVESKFQGDLDIMNAHLYNLLTALLKWYSEKE